MATPNDILPGDEFKVRVLKTLRRLLETDPLTRLQYQGDSIRKFPITTVLEKDPNTGILLPPAVALYSPVDNGLGAGTDGGYNVGRSNEEFGCVLEIALHESQKNAGQDYYDDLNERLQNYYGLYKRALMNSCRSAIAPDDTELWNRLEFHRPNTVEERIAQKMLYSRTYFTLFSQRRIF